MEQVAYVKNPKTGKTIKVGSLTYQNLVKEGAFMNERKRISSLSELMGEMDDPYTLSQLTKQFVLEISQRLSEVDVDVSSVTEDILEMLRKTNQFEYEPGYGVFED